LPRTSFRVIAGFIALALLLPVAVGTIVVIYRSTNDDPDDLSTAVVERPAIPPFGTVRFRVNDDPALYCALLATTAEAMTQGMERREDLGGYDAMVFAFPRDTTTQFVNHFVPVPLQIGWYDKDGGFVDGATMEACPEGDDCPLFSSKDPFRYAIETLSGGLSQLGAFGAGNTVHIGGACS
jgi:uncharacterized membrane protein (UPF0127 family)